MNMLSCLSLSIFLILHNWASPSSSSHRGDCSLNFLGRRSKRRVQERAEIEAVVVGRVFPAVLAPFSIRIETMSSMLVHRPFTVLLVLCRKSHLQASICTDGVSVVTEMIVSINVRISLVVELLAFVAINRIEEEESLYLLCDFMRRELISP
jgi:hypothetical protein